MQGSRRKAAHPRGRGPLSCEAWSCPPHYQERRFMIRTVSVFTVARSSLLVRLAAIGLLACIGCDGGEGASTADASRPSAPSCAEICGRLAAVCGSAGECALSCTDYTAEQRSALQNTCGAITECSALITCSEQVLAGGMNGGVTFGKACADCDGVQGTCQQTSTQCGSGGICFRIYPDPGYCTEPCDDESDCPADEGDHTWRCGFQDGRKYCQRECGCDDDISCTAGCSCDPEC